MYKSGIGKGHKSSSLTETFYCLVPYIHGWRIFTKKRSIISCILMTEDKSALIQPEVHSQYR
jgi:hypothetical protein